MSPLDYSLCTQTVTLYRRQEDTVQRTVLKNCFLQMRQKLETDLLGQQRVYAFLLIVPGEEQLVFPGDRLVEGIGPQTLSWQQTSGFPQVEYAEAYYWEGKLCHIEAGRKG